MRESGRRKSPSLSEVHGQTNPGRMSRGEFSEKLKQNVTILGTNF